MGSKFFIGLSSIFFLVIGCAEPINKATGGALAGSALGAGLGAIVGSQSGHAGAGTAVGAAAGALGGVLIGNTLDSTDKQNQGLRSQIDQQQQTIDENNRLIAELRSRGADVRNTKRGVVINLPDVLFAFDSSRLTSEARRTVSDIAEVVGTTPNRRIAVEGHTDSIGTTGYNERLSYDRAESVARELENKGISHRQLSIHGFGESRPIATNSTEAGRSRNRRVEVIVEN